MESSYQLNVIRGSSSLMRSIRFIRATSKGVEETLGAGANDMMVKGERQSYEAIEGLIIRQIYLENSEL